MHREVQLMLLGMIDPTEVSLGHNTEEVSENDRGNPAVADSTA